MVGCMIRCIDRKKPLSADQSIFKSIAPMLLNRLDKTLDGSGPIGVFRNDKME